MQAQHRRTLRGARREVASVTEPLGDLDLDSTPDARLAFDQRPELVMKLVLKRQDTSAVASHALGIVCFLQLEDEDVRSVLAALVNDDVWHNERVPIVVNEVRTFLRHAQAVRFTPLAVLLGVDLVIREFSLKVHRQSRRDAAFAQILFQQIAILSAQLVESSAKPVFHVLLLHRLLP